MLDRGFRSDSASQGDTHRVHFISDSLVGFYPKGWMGRFWQPQPTNGWKSHACGWEWLPAYKTGDQQCRRWGQAINLILCLQYFTSIICLNARLSWCWSWQTAPVTNGKSATACHRWSARPNQGTHHERTVCWGNYWKGLAIGWWVGVDRRMSGSGRDGCRHLELLAFCF